MAERDGTSESGSDVSTRRGLLRVLARNASERLREVAPVLREARQSVEAFDLGAGDRSGHALETAWREDETPTPARAPVAAVSVEALIELAHHEGLGERDAELRDLARRSLRMTSADPVRAGASILTSDRWTTAGGTDTLVAQIDLAAAAVHESGVPAQGWMVVFVGPAGAEDTAAARTARGVVLDSPAEIGVGLEPMELGAELVLPRLWHESVQRLEFDDHEAEAYLRTRARVHELQGVEDDGDGGLSIAYHRMLGYPNETTGSMPSDCVAASDDQLQPGQWRLLLQISVAARRRLYVWIRDADLRLGRFQQLCAFVR
jgi:Domain of unknown function (DUF1963)